MKYYGGKSDMAFFISDLLDYNTTEYHELFGGCCRVLLNKSYHKKEVYYEYDYPLRTLVEVLTNEIKTFRLIEKLHEITYSEDFFVQYQCKYENYKRNGLKNLFADCFDVLQFPKTLKKWSKHEAFEAELNKLRSKMTLRLNALVFYIHEGKMDWSYLYNKKTPAYIKDIIGDCSKLSSKEGLTDEEIDDVLKRYIGKETGASLLASFWTEYNDIVQYKLPKHWLEPYKESLKVDESEWYQFIENINWVDEHIRNYVDKISDIESYKSYFTTEIEEEYSYFLKLYETLAKAKQTPFTEIHRSNLKRLIALSIYKENIFDSMQNGDIFIDESALSNDEIDVAISAYITYSFSRDGMGNSFSSSAYRSQINYHKSIDSLLEVHYRLQDVEIGKFDDSMQVISVLSLKQDDVMIYADPPYLPAAEVTMEKLEFYNPGIKYTKGWHVRDHVRFIKRIRDINCNVLISNYTDINHLYDDMLVGYQPVNGRKWRKVEYETKTGMASRGSDKRVECLWLNY